jgi:putative ABC transport system ATP-binding protein
MTTPFSPLIYIEDVSRAFPSGGEHSRALDSVDLSIDQGEYVLILGPSGCGKSTLLAIIGLMDSPSEGIYCFDGKPTHTLKASERAQIRNKEIGFVFQNFNLIGDLTVFENVEQPLVYQKMKTSERRARVNEILSRLNIERHAGRRPSHLSGGEQQKVAIARALVTRPRILLADEPTGNLDSASGESIMEMLRQIHESGTTVCLVTHDPRFVKMADRLIHMFDGRLTEDHTINSAMMRGL